MLKNITLSLSKELTSFIDTQVGNKGLYRTVSEYISDIINNDRKKQSDIEAEQSIVAGVNDDFDLTTQKRDGTTGVGAITITLSPGTKFAAEIALDINTQMIAAGLDYLVADENGEGSVRLKTFVAAAASSIILAAGGDDALGTLGLTAATTNGVVAGGTTPQGSYIMLTNPKNLIWGQLDATRMFTEFNKDSDRIESVIYNQLATAIENVDALVKVKNIRSRDLIV